MDDIAPITGTSPPQKKLGPYERWMAEFGKDYDLPPMSLDHPSYLSGIARFSQPQPTLPAPNDMADTAVTVGSMGSWRPTLSPVMWRGPQGREFHYSFLPMLMEARTRTEDPAGVFNAQVFESLVASLHEDFDAHIAMRKVIADASDPLREFPPGFESFLEDFLNEPPPDFSFGFPLQARSVNVSQPQDAPRTVSRATRSQAVFTDDTYDPEKPLVIVAVIDDAIPFAHKAFRCKGSGKTRIDYFWSQSAEADGTMLFGRELSGRAIDDLIMQHDGDEDVLYRRAGVLGGNGGPVSALAGNFSHGAHVAGLAAGDWPADSDANVRIIAVDLPVSSSWDTSGFGKDMFVLSAMHYIFDRADRIAEAYGSDTPPLIVNLSYGYSGGPKDGTGLIELAMGEMIHHRRSVVRAPTAVVMPSGNMFLDRLHAVVTEKHIAKGKTATLPWRILPDDRTSSFLEIWLPAGVGAEHFHFAVLSPDGTRVIEETGNVELPRTIDMDVDGKRVGQFSIDQLDTTNAAARDSGVQPQTRIMLALAPTESMCQLPGAPAGLWKIEISYANGAEEGKLHGYTTNILNERVPADIRCWIQRDVSFGTHDIGAKQSFFDDPLNTLYDSHGRPYDTDSVWRDGFLVRRFGSINGMSTHPTVLVVGGYVRNEYRPAPYSSAGFLRKKDASEWAWLAGDQVDCVAPSEESWIDFGIRSIGTRSGMCARMNGTSVAAPQVSRKLALYFAGLTNPGSSGDDWITETGNYVRKLKPDRKKYISVHGTIKQKDEALIGQGLID